MENNSNNKNMFLTYQLFQTNNKNNQAIYSRSKKCSEILNIQNTLPTSTIVGNTINLNLQLKDLSNTSNILIQKKNERKFQPGLKLYNATDKN